MNKKIGDIMTTEVRTLKSSDTIKTAARIMKDCDTGFVPIVENEKVIGVVTDRDLVTRGYFNGLNGSNEISEVMTTSCITADKDMSVEEAAELMAKNKVRRLCVLSDGKLSGICAIGDISISKGCSETAGTALSEISERNYNYSSI